jgi:hypothetical protein
MESPIDFSALKGLWDTLTPVVTSIPKVFSKNFFKERFHLHFLITFVIVLAAIRLLFLYCYLGDTPIWFHIIIGYMIGYGINFVREGYYFKKGAPWSQLDVYAGAYGGTLATILYNLL